MTTSRVADGWSQSTSCEPATSSKGSVGSGYSELIELMTTAERIAGNGKPEVSVELYQQWLQRHPVDPLRYVGLFNQAKLLSQTQQLERALSACSEAIQLAPTFLGSYIHIGLVLEQLGRADEAIRCWSHAADCLAPVNGENLGYKTLALTNLARVFGERRDLRSAEQALRRCLEIDQQRCDIISAWVCVREQQCEWPVIQPWGNLTVSQLMSALQPITMAMHTNDPMYQLSNAWRHFGAGEVNSHGPGTVGRWVPPASVPLHATRPLRVGYVSPDLREHAIGSLTGELFELHDRTRVEVFAYYSGREGPDAIQAKIRATVDHWTSIAGWSDKQAARKIVSDEIDILVDLGGHTKDAPTATFALRPAPIIVNWLGYPGSMGTPHHQYIIADETIIPPSYEKFYSERVMRLPCYQPTDRKRLIARQPSRWEVGLSEQALVYCCFNGRQKITPMIFRCWMSILNRVPHAVLWLLSSGTDTDERLRQQAIRSGISPARLIFAPRAPHGEHLARYPLADLFLDTWPYGAHTTASDALWMGVPVLTMIGHSFASRVCASLVRAAGLEELVCDDPEAYEDYAVKLGTQSNLLTGLRERLRAARDHCTLFDMPHLVTQLESLYEQMWNEYLSGAIPEPSLENLAVYNAIGDGLDHESAAVLDLKSYEQCYVREIAYRDSISPVPPDCRLWPGRQG